MLMLERNATGVTADDRKKTFRKLSSQWHPDKKGGIKEVFQFLQERKRWFVNE